jgi:hypothetical protein
MYNPTKYYTSVSRVEGKEMLRKAIMKQLDVKHFQHTNPTVCNDRYGTCDEERCDCGESFMLVNGQLKKTHHE